MLTLHNRVPHAWRRICRNWQFGNGGGSEVDGPGYILSHDEEFDSTDEVRLMDP
jgi:hypothetical protein